MSGEGRPRPEGLPDGTGLRVAVVAARWHAEVTDSLLANAQAALRECEVGEVTVLRVPGAFEVPVAALALARRHDAVVCLAAVVRGGTPHFEFVSRAVTDGCVQVSVRTGVPVSFGVLTCDTLAQARDRAGLPGSAEDKGREAALAAVETVRQLRSVGASPASEPA